MVAINGANDLVRMIRCGETSKVQFKLKLYLPDEEPVLGTSVADLDDKRIDRFLQKVYGKGRDDFDVPFETLLNNLKITSADGSLTLAGLLFFGKHPEWTKPSFIIKAVAFYGNSIGDTQYKDSRDLDGTIPEQFDQAMRFLDNNLHHIQAGQSFNSLGILEVSRIALEEILQNAQVHREYIKTAPIRLLIFANRIEIISPGCLPGNMTVEGIQLGETFQRNPLLASFCAKTMVYRGLGSGIVRARKDGAKIEFRNDEDTNQFIATIWRNELAEKSASLDENSASLSEKGLSSAEKGLSNEKKGLSSAEKGLSLGEKGPSLDKKGLSKKELQIERLLEFCEVPRGLSEISRFMEMTNKSKLRNNYIYPLIGKRLAMTFPNSPKSPTQKYYTIHEEKD